MSPFLPAVKALADDSRLRILWMLEERALCVCEIQAVLGLAQSTVSRHLQTLVDAGYLTSEKEGLWTNYRPHPTPPPLVQGLLAQARLAGLDSSEAKTVREQARTKCRDNLCGPANAA